MEEANPLVEPTDMEGEQLVTLVNKAVSAITTRVQSKIFLSLFFFVCFGQSKAE